MRAKMARACCSAKIFERYLAPGAEYEVASKLQRVNHFPKTTGITKKDCLLRNMRRMRGIHGPIYDFFPEAYLLPTEYMTMVRVCKELAGRGVKPIWILKPTDASQGRKIFLIRDLAEISYGHFSSSIAAAAADLRGEGGGDDDADGGGGEERERAIATEIDMATTLRMLDDAVVRLRSDLDLERRDREAVEEEILGLLDAAVVGAGS